LGVGLGEWLGVGETLGAGGGVARVLILVNVDVSKFGSTGSKYSLAFGFSLAAFWEWIKFDEPQITRTINVITPTTINSVLFIFYFNKTYEEVLLHSYITYNNKPFR
jgi:hypothetical protein